MPGSPQAIAIASDGQLGFVALADGRVLMLDVLGRSIVASITVGGTPRFVITGLYPPASVSWPPVTSPSPGFAAPVSLFIALGLLAGVGLLGGSWFAWRWARKEGEGLIEK